MKIPEGVEVYETPTSTYWFEGPDFVCSISKPAENRTLEEAKQAIDEFKSLAGNKKYCFLMDITNTSPSSKEVRDYAAAEFPKIAKAMAIISDSAFGTMMANMFFKIKKQPFPVKMFKDEAEARDWLKNISDK
jgi:predicted metal-dependent phosphoesterase TrpH